MGLRAAFEYAKGMGLFINVFLASRPGAAEAVKAHPCAMSRLCAQTINTIIHSAVCTDFNFPTE